MHQLAIMNHEPSLLMICHNKLTMVHHHEPLLIALAIRSEPLLVIITRCWGYSEAMGDMAGKAREVGWVVDGWLLSFWWTSDGNWPRREYHQQYTQQESSIISNNEDILLMIDRSLDVVHPMGWCSSWHLGSSRGVSDHRSAKALQAVMPPVSECCAAREARTERGGCSEQFRRQAQSETWRFSHQSSNQSAINQLSHWPSVNHCEPNLSL